MLVRRDIGPPVPWANTNLLTNIVDAEDSTARVRTSDDERPLTALKWLINNGAHESLPLALNLRHVNLAGFH